MVTSEDFAKSTQILATASVAAEEPRGKGVKCGAVHSLNGSHCGEKAELATQATRLPLNANSHAATGCDNMRAIAKVAEEGFEPPTRGL